MRAYRPVASFSVGGSGSAFSSAAACNRAQILRKSSWRIGNARMSRTPSFSASCTNAIEGNSTIATTGGGPSAERSRSVHQARSSTGRSPSPTSTRSQRPDESFGIAPATSDAVSASTPAACDQRLISRSAASIASSPCDPTARMRRAAPGSWGLTVVSENGVKRRLSCCAEGPVMLAAKVAPLRHFAPSGSTPGEIDQSGDRHRYGQPQRHGLKRVIGLCHTRNEELIFRPDVKLRERTTLRDHSLDGVPRHQLRTEARESNVVNLRRRRRTSGGHEDVRDESVDRHRVESRLRHLALNQHAHEDPRMNRGIAVVPGHHIEQYLLDAIAPYAGESEGSHDRQHERRPAAHGERVGQLRLAFASQDDAVTNLEFVVAAGAPLRTQRGRATHDKRQNRYLPAQYPPG